MSKVRTREDELRLDLARRRERIRKTKQVPSKEEVLQQVAPLFDAVLANFTDEDIRSISSEGLDIWDRWAPDVDPPLSGEQLMSWVPGWHPEDVFFSEAPGKASKESPSSRDEPNLPVSPRGRPPAACWPDALAHFGLMMIDEDYDVTQEAMLNRLLDRLAEHGVDAKRSTLQPGISKFYALLRETRK